MVNVCELVRLRTLGSAMACALVLAGCTLDVPNDAAFAEPDTAPASAGLAGIFAPRNSPPASAKALSEARLGQGDIVLKGPDGWCIEPRSLKARRGTSFASLAGCHALTQGQVSHPVAAGLVTVTVSAPRDNGDISASTALQQAVARDRLLSSQEADGMALVHLRPVTAASAAGPGDPHWRALFVQGRRVVALAAYGPKAGALSGAEGGRLLTQIASNIRRHSPTPSRPGAPVAAKKTPVKGGGLFGRLLNRKVSE